MENLPSLEITVLILAGGKSSRMGRDKALIPINGVPLLQRTYLIAKECSNSVYIVAEKSEKYQDILPNDCSFLSDFPLLGEKGSQGPLIGFAGGLREVETPWVLLLACDLPRLEAEEIKQWIGYLSAVEEEAIALLPKSDKGWEPFCGFYRRHCWPLLIDFIQQGGRSFQRWLALHPVAELPMNSTSILFNCNTPADLLAVTAVRPTIT